jgi:hypothetical protein
MSNQRSESRRVRMAKVAVLAPSQTGKVHRESAFMEDVNRTGAGLRTRFPLPVGFPLLLEVQDQVCAATVRHCSHDGAEYFVGIEFDKPADDLSLGRLQRAHGFAVV